MVVMVRHEAHEDVLIEIVGFDHDLANGVEMPTMLRM